MVGDELVRDTLSRTHVVEALDAEAARNFTNRWLIRVAPQIVDDEIQDAAFQTAERLRHDFHMLFHLRKLRKCVVDAADGALTP